MASLGQIIDGRFRLDARAGAGGGAIVYRAFDQIVGVAVAVKLPHGEETADPARFVREIGILREVDAPGIVGYVAHGLDPTAGPYLAMEWLDGETLSERLARGRLTANETISVGVSLAETLTLLHAAGVIHRDLKPSNVFLVDRDLQRIKLLDFGIARSATHAAITVTGALLGTAGYMSPEQVRGETSIDHRTDVFSLGCVLYQCATGRLPFEGSSPTEWLLKLAFEDAPRAREVSGDVGDGLSAALERMVERSAVARFESMTTVARTLNAARLADANLVKTERSARAPVITDIERRFASALLLRGPTPEGLGSFLLAELDHFGGILHESPDGTLLVRFGSAESPTDLARSAARLALAITDRFPDARPVVLSTRATASDGAKFDETLDRARGLLRCAGPGLVVVDDATRGLLQGAMECEAVDRDVAGMGITQASRAYAIVASDAAGPHSARPRRRSPFVGREREIGTISGAFDHVVSHSAAEIILVLGPPGIGKSRLLEEARAQLRAHPASPTVLVGSAEGAERTASLGLVRSMLRRFFAVAEVAADPTGARAAVRAGVARWVEPLLLAVVADFLCELLGIPDGGAPSFALVAARAEPRLMTDQVGRAVELLLRGLNRANPLVISVEYLHWADPASIAFLDRFIGTSLGASLLVIGGGRPETTERFPKLFAERSVTTISLRELLPKPAGDLTRSALQGQVDEAMVRRIVELGGGNPLFLEELGRAAREGLGPELPDTVLALSQSRLDHFPLAERRWLRAASVFGQSFTPSGVAALLAGKPDPRALDSLATRDVLRAHDDLAKRDTYVFRSAILREVAYASIPREHVAGAHLRAAEHLESAGDVTALELAHHFERGEAGDRAAAWYLRAGREALEVNDLAAATAWSERAIATDETSSKRGAALTLRAEVEDLKWAWADAKRYAAEAMELLPVGDVLWFMAAHVLIHSTMRSRDIPGFVDLVARVREIEPTPAARNTAVFALASAANSMAVSGQTDLAKAVVARVDVLTKDLPAGSSGFAYAALARGGLAVAASDLGAYRTLRFEAADRFDELFDWRKSTEVRGTAGYADGLLGRYEEALETLNACVARAEAHGMAIVHYLRHNVGLVELQMGRLEQARVTLESTLDPLRATDVRLYGGSVRYLARTYVGLGKRAIAEKYAREALEKADRETAKKVAKADLASVILGRGNVDEAHTLATEAAEGLLADGPFDESEMFVRLTLVHVRRLKGDMEGARDAAAAAKVRLEALAAKIDPRFRQGFLEKVPEHARLMKLATAR